MVIKTGEVLDRDSDDNLYLCESFEDTETGLVYTTRTLLEDRN
jgi:hypothetical protein